MIINNNSTELCIITPTRDRPICLELSERWARNQTWPGEVRWIVVDDGQEQARLTMGQMHIRRQRGPKDPAHTLPLNLNMAIDASMDCKRFLIWEDDEYLGPRYVETMMAWLDRAPLVGELGAKYYHVGRRAYKHFVKHTHASLCRTGFTAKALPFFQEIVRRCIRQRTPSVDLKLWGNWRGDTYKFRDTTGDARLCVGIKGMPGLPAANHERSDYLPDPDLAQLKLWVGDDYQHYLPFAGKTGQVQAAAPAIPRTPPQLAPRRVPLRTAEPPPPAEPLTIYTTIFGNYDKLKRAYQAAGLSYVCFTDSPKPSNIGWKIVQVEAPDPVAAVRWYKMHPHELFPEAMRSLWIDASMTFKVNPRAIASAARDAEVYLSRHHARDCILQEAEACIRLGRCDGPSIDQARGYVEAGHPRHWGLYCGGLIYRVHTEAVARFNEAWWAEFEKWHKRGASRDQVSLAPTLRASGVKFGSFDKTQRGRWVVLMPHHVITPSRRAAEQGTKRSVCPHCKKPIEV